MLQANLKIESKFFKILVSYSERRKIKKELYVN